MARFAGLALVGKSPGYQLASASLHVDESQLLQL